MFALFRKGKFTNVLYDRKPTDQILGAISSVNNSQIKTTPTSLYLNALTGRLPGFYTQEITGFSLMLKSSSNVKFMALINPDETPDLALDLDIVFTEDDLVKVKNTTSFGETVALKLSSVYKKI